MLAALTLLGQSFPVIGPRVNRLLIAQLVAVTLVGGLATRLIAPLIDALRQSAELRAAAFIALAVALLLFRRVLHRGLCLESIASLRRQPLGDFAFALLVLPWAVPLAWWWALLAWLGHPERLSVVAAIWLLGALAVVGVASATSFPRLAVWTFAPRAAVLLLDRMPTIAFATNVLSGFGLAGGRLAGASVRAGLVRLSRGHGSGAPRTGRTPLGALLSLDRRSLHANPWWCG